MHERPEEHFDEALRTWASRPPETSPRQAAAQLRERLPGREPRLPWWRPAATLAALALVVVLGWTLWLRPQPQATATVVEVPPLDANVVLIWLDPETPLYMTMSPPVAAEEENPS